MATKNIFELLPDSDNEESTQQDVKKPAGKSENKKEKPQAAGSQQKSKEATSKTSGGKLFLINNLFVINPPLPQLKKIGLHQARNVRTPAKDLKEAKAAATPCNTWPDLKKVTKRKSMRNQTEKGPSLSKACRQSPTQWTGNQAREEGNTLLFDLVLSRTLYDLRVISEKK